MNDIVTGAASQTREAPSSQALSGRKEEMAGLDWLSTGWRYQVDVRQRTLLFLDTLRQRADKSLRSARHDQCCYFASGKPGRRPGKHPL